MKQLHIVHDISIRSGGLGLAALGYAQAVAKAGANVTLFVANRTVDELDFQVTEKRFVIDGATSHSGGGWAVLWEQGKAVRRCLMDSKFDVVHLHGTWSPILAIAAYMAHSRNILYVLSPHGCLAPWALGHRKFKKQVALQIYQRRVLKSASMLVATANQELENIRDLGIDSPVAVLPNGVDLASAPNRHANGTRKILFLSRIHPQKGLGDLVLAWARVRKPGWQVVVAGPSQGGYEDEIKSLIRKHGLESDFCFPGLVSGERKERCFSEADVFVLPTYSENFGIAVAEALARGIPVITTKGAPWQELETYRCGWWVAPGVDGVAAGLSAAMAMSRDVLAEMGSHGKALVEEKYSWDRIGRDALLASEWILERKGARPSCINVADVD